MRCPIAATGPSTVKPSAPNDWWARYVAPSAASVADRRAVAQAVVAAALDPKLGPLASVAVRCDDAAACDRLREQIGQALGAYSFRIALDVQPAAPGGVA